jgi:glycosyltransferase involved in cell wall biosynthesis
MLFTVFTPVYNRRDKLHRVWDSLRAQDCRDFEWVVVDDGSTDNVQELLQTYEREADFPVRVAVQANGGKHAAWNRGVSMAQGELFVPADSDDAFVPETLSRFRHWWHSIGEHERRGFSGVNVLCKDPESGQVVGTPFPSSPMVSNNLELAYVHRITGEKWGCIRSDVLREVPFPTDPSFRGHYLAEAYLWFSIARRYKVLCVNEPLRLYYRDAANSIVGRHSKGGTMHRLNQSVPTRYFFKNWHLNTNLDYLSRSPKELLATVADVWVSGLSMRGSVTKVLGEVRMGLPLLLMLGAMPGGIGLYLYKRARSAGEGRRAS